jgi:hypothetical protein
VASIVEKIIQKKLTGAEQKLTPEQQAEQNRAAMKETLADMDLSPEETQKKIHSLAQTPGRESDANFLRMQAGLKEAVPAVAGVAGKIKLTTGPELIQKLKDIKEKSQPIVDQLKKSRDLMKPEFYDSAVNIAKRAVTDNRKTMDVPTLQRILTSYGKMR